MAGRVGGYAIGVGTAIEGGMQMRNARAYAVGLVVGVLLLAVAGAVLVAEAPQVSAAKPTTTMTPPTTARPITTFTVHGFGDYVSPAVANISGTAICSGGIGLLTFTTVVGFGYTVTGEQEIVCDGVSHAWAATIVGGPWVQGQVILFQATLTAPSGMATTIPKVILR